jgi:hypothetical protein
MLDGNVLTFCEAGRLQTSKEGGEMRWAVSLD